MEQKEIWIIGANSDIAKELAKKLSHTRFLLRLASRNTKELKRFIRRERIRNAVVKELDLCSRKSIQDFVKEASVPWGIILAAGYLPQMPWKNQLAELDLVYKTNLLGNIYLIEQILPAMKQKRDGFITGISSVADVRGKASNKLYASSKAAFTSYLQGTMQECAPYGVQVDIIKPGYVKTKMISHKKEVCNALFTLKPDQVAEVIYQHIKRRRSRDQYVNLPWAAVIPLTRLIPTCLYRKLNL